MRGLRALFQPGSVAVIGASDKETSLGSMVMANLHGAGFRGPVLPVHPKYRSVHRILCYPGIDALPVVPDLAVLCTPAAVTAELIARLGERGTRAAIVIAADPDGHGPGTPFKQALRQAGRAHGVRILGPGSAGVRNPALGLDASALGARTKPGKLALISQSSSIADSVVEWASSHGIGFSHVVSVGDGVDVDVPDLLDYFAADMKTKAALVYLRAVADGRAFLSAARAVSRIKPVLAIKPEEFARDPGEGPWVAPDAVYDAAFRRAGMLRVRDISEWFDAVESLGYGKYPSGNGRLAILCNGSGPGQLAAAAVASEGRLAELSEATLATLKTGLPARVRAGNPLDIGRDADPARYVAALQALTADSQVGAILAIHSPSALAPAETVAKAVADAARKTQRQVIACWLGGPVSREIRAIFAEAAVPLFETPEKAAQAFLHLVHYRGNQEALMQLPSARPSRRDGAESGLLLHDEAETKAILQAYGSIARHILEDEAEMNEAESLAVLRAYGFSAGRIVDGRLPLSLSVADDPVFGRVIVLEGAGQRAVAFPPLNMKLAEPVVAAVLPAVQAVVGAAVDPRPLQAALVRVSDLLIELPEISGLRIASLGIADGEVMVSRAMLRVSSPDNGAVHLSIRPYPHQLEQRIELKDGRQVLVRPLRPEDEPLYRDMLGKVAPEDLFLRFCTRFGGEAHSVPRELLAKLIQIDYDRDMSFIALVSGADGQPEALGVVDSMAQPDRSEAEFSILLRSDLKGAGLGKALMEKMIAYVRSQNIEHLMGVILRNNQGMRGLCTRLGFTTTADPDDDMVTVTLPLGQARPAQASM